MRRSTYSEKRNPYKQWHMQRAFRLGWEASEKGFGEQRAQRRAAESNLNRVTTTAYWRGYRTQRGEY